MKCIAYIRHGRDGNGWMACARRSAAGSVFCRMHRDAANGVILGLWVNGFPERPGVEQSPRPCEPELGVPLKTSANSFQ